MKNILGISSLFHDAVAAFTFGGEIITDAQEELFIRGKKTPDFSTPAIKYCIEEAGPDIYELDVIDFNNKPSLKFESLPETYYSFAPSVLSEKCSAHFELETDSTYRLLFAPLIKDKSLQLPVNLQDLPLWKRLYFGRSDLPLITHFVYSERIQTVHKKTNSWYWELKKALDKQTKYGLCTLHDVYRCFMCIVMDYLVINDFVYCKTEKSA